MDYQKVYNTLISFRKSNPLEKSDKLYTEVHHIVPRCMGGSDDPENLVRLTAREHFIAHRLLAKIHPTQTGLSKAVFAMRNVNGMRVSAKTYELLKRKFCESVSKTMLVVNSNPDYIANKSSSTSRQWRSIHSRDKLVEGLNRSWKENERRRMKASQATKRQMKDPSMLAHSLKNLKKMQGDATWNSAMSISRGTRPYWALAALFWRSSEFNPNNCGGVIRATGFSRLYDCGERIQVHQYMVKKFREGWVPHEDQLWLRDFGDDFK